MDYEQKYKNAIERAKELLEDMNEKDYFASSGDIENIFPELREQESEDERIRKAIKKALQVRCNGSRIISDEPVTLEEAIAWLEKQSNKSVNIDVELLTKVLIKHLYTCVNETNTYVRSKEDHIALPELIAKIKADLNIE